MAALRASQTAVQKVYEKVASRVEYLVWNLVDAKVSSSAVWWVAE